MMPLEKRMLRLERWNLLLVLTLLLALLVSGSYARLNALTANLKTLRLYEQPNGDLGFVTSSDKPLVVTHLVCIEPGRGPIAVAALPVPVAIVSSGNKNLTRAQIARLSWIDNYGEPMTKFLPNSQFEALYHRPFIAKWK